MARRAWGWVLLAALGLALVSLVTDLPGQLDDELLATRLTLSKLANAGTVWAGLLILAGRLVRDFRQAAAAGILSGWLSLGAHYALGQALGVYTAHIWAENLNWFLITGALGAPLGLIGAATARTDGWGTLARLAVPAGAVVEPFYRGMFRVGHEPWPGALANAVCGGALLLLGVAGLALALRRGVAARAVLDSAA